MRSVRVIATMLALVGALVSSGCASMLEGNLPREAEREPPSEWGNPGGMVLDAGVGTSVATQQRWDEFFTDPHLRALIEQALDTNQELGIRMQEIVIARSEVGGRRGEYLPMVGAGAGAGIEKVSSYSSQGAADEANGVPKHLPYLGFGLSASWEIDIWGKLRNAAKSANQRYLASIEAKNFVTTEVVAEVAAAYYELLALDTQIDVLDRYITLLEDALAIVRLKKEAARATELAVQRFEAEVLLNQGRRFDLEQRRIEAENRINFLLGRYPQHVERDASRFMTTEPPELAAGLPSELLDNRPDVRQAELLLEAAKLDVKVAKAQFYPSLSIEAGVGYSAFNARHLLSTPESLVYDVAGNLFAPLLNRAAIKADYRKANALQIEAVLEFERTLIGAFTEVVNYLAMTDNLAARFERERAQVDTLEQVVETSNVLYESARADYMEVLLTRRDALDAEMELIDTRKEQLLAVVGLYRALGGGWRSDEPLPDAAGPRKRPSADLLVDLERRPTAAGQHEHATELAVADDLVLTWLADDAAADPHGGAGLEHPLAPAKAEVEEHALHLRVRGDDLHDRGWQRPKGAALATALADPELERSAARPHADGPARVTQFELAEVDEVVHGRPATHAGLALDQQPIADRRATRDRCDARGLADDLAGDEHGPEPERGDRARGGATRPTTQRAQPRAGGERGHGVDRFRAARTSG